jgi:predicted Fe-S protein YdhL (DUF1289 family)
MKEVPNILITTLCSTTGKLEKIDQKGVCEGCGRKVNEPLEGDKFHKTQFSRLELRGRMRRMGYREVLSLLDDDGNPRSTPRRFRCELTGEQVNRILESGISFSGLGMYSVMCEYEPDTRFTLETLSDLASNSLAETEAILNELLNAGYAYREDEMEEGMAVYSVNRDLQPDPGAG